MQFPAKNLLASETSPYLIQHKDNPVHWRPWSKAALDEAAATGKPILLSIGYAACHWCHVMAHECFEDREVADVMNRLFVNIKVDREERPDIDQIFMAALAATGEQGGWPLTMFLTPGGKPFWGGTYFPKHARYGRPGFIDVMNHIARAVEQRGADVTENAQILHDHVQDRLSVTAEAVQPEARHVTALANGILKMVDTGAGGFGSAPKFPSAPMMETLWLAHLTTREDKYRDPFIHSLREMSNGGIYDHLAGGLCRYATDSNWLVPHFEKMLYDNAAFIRHCIWAHAASSDSLFRQRIESTVSWILDEMLLPTGGFASSLDADSAGEEGKFYVWQKSEIDSLPGISAKTLCGQYDVTTEGNWEGKNILHRRHGGATLPEDDPQLTQARTRLLEERAKRIRPGRDDKLLVDWNGLTIRALSEAGRYCDRRDWIEAASRTYGFIKSNTAEGRLPHSIGANGRCLFPCFSSDYSAMILAAIALFEATGEAFYADDAARWADALDSWHGDGEGGYFMTATDATDTPMRLRGDTDDAVHAATGLAVEAIHRLALLTSDPDRVRQVEKLTAAAIGRVAQTPYGQSGVFNAAAMTLEPIKLIVTSKVQGLISAANRLLDPRRIDVVMNTENARTLARLTNDAIIQPGSPGAYLCIGQTCLPPITDPAVLAGKLNDPGR